MLHYGVITEVHTKTGVIVSKGNEYVFWLDQAPDGVVGSQVSFKLDYIDSVSDITIIGGFAEIIARLERIEKLLTYELPEKFLTGLADEGA